MNTAETTTHPTSVGKAHGPCRAASHGGVNADDLAYLIDRIEVLIPPTLDGHDPVLAVGNHGARAIDLVIDPGYFEPYYPPEVGPVPAYDQLAGVLGTLADECHVDEFGATDEGHRWLFRFQWD